MSNQRFGVLRVINAKLSFLRRDGMFSPWATTPAAEFWNSEERERAYTHARGNAGLCCEVPDSTPGPTIPRDPNGKNGTKPHQPTVSGPVSDAEHQRLAAQARELTESLRKQMSGAAE